MLYNSFETVIFPAFPKLRLIKEHFLKEGAAAALMSGSGASIFALFRCATRAAAVAQDMQRSCPAVFVHHF